MVLFLKPEITLERGVDGKCSLYQVLEAILEKNRLHKVACKSSKLEDWDIFRQARKRARNLFLHTKEEVLRSQVKDNFSNPRRFWHKIN